MDIWIQWTVATLISLGSLVVAYFGLRKKPKPINEQKISKDIPHPSIDTHSIYGLTGGYTTDLNEEAENSIHQNQVSERDRQIIKHLFTEVLDMDMAQDTLEVQSTWYGYKKDAIYNLIEFTERAVKLSNRVSNRIIQSKINDLVEAIDEFHHHCSKAVSDYDRNEWFYCIGKQEAGSYEKKKQELAKAEDIDRIGLIAYEKLTDLTDLLRQKNLL